MNKNKKNQNKHAIGGSVKAIGNGIIEGVGVRFGSETDVDLSGEFFTSETFLGQSDALPLFYQHGYDSVLGLEPLKSAGSPIMATKTNVDDAGLWFQAQLDLSNQYQAYLYTLAEQGRLGYSTGAVGHLVETEPKGAAYWIKTWVLGEISLTPNPCEPRNVVLPSVKMTIPDGMSLNELSEHVTSAWYSQNPDTHDEVRQQWLFRSYVMQIFEAFIIVRIKENETSRLYRIAYVQDGSTILFSSERVEVMRIVNYETVSPIMKALKSAHLGTAKASEKEASSSPDDWDSVRTLLNILDKSLNKDDK